MAVYVTYYTVKFTNNLHEDIDILFQKKDGDPGVTPQEYKIRDLKIKVNASGDDPLFATILSRECEVTFSVGEEDSDYWPDFEKAAKDEWKVIVISNTQFYFHGLVIPDEGRRPFQDPPYDATIKASDGLGLLKSVDLTDFDGSQLTSGEYTGINYIAMCLSKTGLDLPIRIYDHVYHVTMQNRTAGYQFDMWQQFKLDFRAFQKAAEEFQDCYEILRRLFSRTHRLFYQNGEYVIHRLDLFQYVPAGNLYYTVYDARGENPEGFLELENYGSVGKAEVIRAINKDAIQSSKFAMKSVKSSFEYFVFPELPKNNKFERGVLVDEFPATDDCDLDGDGDFDEIIGTRRRLAINHWVHGEFDLLDSPNFTMDTSPVDPPLINKVVNDFGTEILREVSIPPTPNQGSGKVSGLLSDRIPVVEGDRITFAVDKRYSQDIDAGDDSFSLAAIVQIIPEGGGDAFYLISNFNNPETDGAWADNFTFFSFVAGIFVRFGNIDARKYTSVTVDSQPIPVTGDMRIILVNPIGGATAFYRNFTLEYMPMVAGGFIKVKGEYVQRAQNGINFSDKSAEPIYLADNRHKVFQGAMLDLSGASTTPEWYRYGLPDERREYKDLTNLAEFNLLYRRFWEIQGTFRGTTYRPQNNYAGFLPMGFHKPVRFEDIPGEHRRFILVVPWDMNLMTGQATATFAEILQVGLEPVVATESFDFFRGRIVVGINRTSAAVWDEQNAAPPPQIGFPPIAYVYPDNSFITGQPRAIGLVINKDNEMTVSGNGLSVIYNAIEISNGQEFRRMIFQFATEDLIEGNTYTFTAYGHTLIFVVGLAEIFEQDDGKQEGDQVEKKFYFK